MMRLLFLITCLFLSPLTAVAQEEKLPDPAREEMAREIMKGIRCLVCQNQSVDESNAGLARDLRDIIRERVAAGDNPDQVRAWLVARYGDWVLLKPPFDTRTALLWFAPLLFMMAGGVGIIIYIRKRNRDPALTPAPLSAQEKKKLQAMLSDDQNGTEI